MVNMNRFDEDIADNRDRKSHLNRLIGMGDITRGEVDAFILGRNPYPLPANKMRQWQNFYTFAFDMPADSIDELWEVDEDGVKLPEGVSQCFAILEGVSYVSVVKAYAKLGLTINWSRHMPLSSVGRLADTRLTKRASYKMFTPGGLEADADCDNVSAHTQMLDKAQGMTLLERLVFGLFYYWVTNGTHIDRYTTTLCTGSRLSGDNTVPIVHANSPDGSVSISACSVTLQSKGMRMREVF